MVLALGLSGRCRETTVKIIQPPIWASAPTFRNQKDILWLIKVTYKNVQIISQLKKKCQNSSL